MDLPVDAAKMTGTSDQISIWDSKRLSAFRRNPMSSYLHQCIDTMGQGSKTAQGLSAVLTSTQRLHDNPGHRLYLYCVDRHCVGIMKVGVKKLFIRSRNGKLNEIDPMCVLDFYVHESAQRSGYGRVLYDFMLKSEGVPPSKLGYDRPSNKFLSFLQKHFSLSDYVPQTNNFVVFSQYFDDNGEGRGSGRFGGSRGGSNALQSSSLHNNQQSPPCGRRSQGRTQDGMMADAHHQQHAMSSSQHTPPNSSSSMGHSQSSLNNSTHSNRSSGGSSSSQQHHQLDSQRTTMLMHPHQHDRERAAQNGPHTAPGGSLMSSGTSASSPYGHQDQRAAMMSSGRANLQQPSSSPYGSQFSGSTNNNLNNTVSQRTAMAQEVLAASRSSMLGSIGTGGSRYRRAQSPTRSGVGYNILSPEDKGAPPPGALGDSRGGGAHHRRGDDAMDFAQSAKFGDRPLGRQGGRAVRM